jgi:hypothetical protein
MVTYSVGDLEFGKFIESPTNKPTTLRTQITNPSTSPIPTYVDFRWDTVDETEPDATHEVYTFKLNSVTVKVITLTYFDATKARLLQVTKV